MYSYTIETFLGHYSIHICNVDHLLSKNYENLACKRAICNAVPEI